LLGIADHELQFRQWLAEHTGLLLKVVRSFAEGPADQDDLFQEILLQVWLSLPNFRDDSKPTTWLYRVGPTRLNARNDHIARACPGDMAIERIAGAKSLLLFWEPHSANKSGGAAASSLVSIGVTLRRLARREGGTLACSGTVELRFVVKLCLVVAYANLRLSHLIYRIRCEKVPSNRS
jgi:hypothetical protein